MILLWMACSASDKETDTAPANTIDWTTYSVMAQGPFQVGHKQIEHTYTAISDQAERSISIEIWYPTTDTTGIPAEYFIGVDDNVFANASIADSIHEGGYPVMVSSHGYRGWGANSPFLMSHFASHGWIVIAPNHINNTLADHQSPLPISHFIHRPKDISQSLDVVFAMDWPDALQTDSVVLSGHSFGASYSTWAGAGASYDNIDAVCFEGVGLEDPDRPCSDAEYAELSSGLLHDPRVKVAIPMAGSDRKTFFGETGYQSVHAPVLFISGTEDNEESNQNHFADVTGIDFQWLSLEGGCHISFTTGGCPTMESQLGFDILNAYVLAFARQRLLNDSSDEVSNLLNGTTQPWTEASLKIKE